MKTKEMGSVYVESADLTVEGDFALDELLEFLDGDASEVRADPAFKEQLRRVLWDLTLTLAPGWKRRDRH